MDAMEWREKVMKLMLEHGLVTIKEGEEEPTPIYDGPGVIVFGNIDMLQFFDDTFKLGIEIKQEAINAGIPIEVLRQFKIKAVEGLVQEDSALPPAIINPRKH